MKTKLIFFVILVLTSTVSCDSNQRYFPYNEGEQIFYDVFFQDKENKKKNYRQSFYFLPKIENAIPVLKNDGEVIFYVFEKQGILIKNLDSFLSSKQKISGEKEPELLLAFPVKKDISWETNDKTTIQMKLGYDRFYNTNLPLKLINKIVSTDESITINGKKIKNCIKVSGYGKTSYYPDPTIGNINIEIFTTTWFAKGIGLLKYKREEISDSETMGKILYDKTIMLDN